MATPTAAAAAATAARRVATIAVAQMTSRSDMAANAAAVRALAREAASAGAVMLFLPECFNFFGSEAVRGSEVLEPLDGPALSRYRAIAAETGVWLSLGGFQELAPPGAPARGHNTHVVIDGRGALAAVYRKAHLFDLTLPGLTLRESEHTAPGGHLAVADTPVGRLGLSVCYDLRFPELYRALAGAGAQLLAVPAAFTVPTGAAHWEALLRARAIENQCYVVAAAQVGAHNAARTSYGHAMVVDPWGVVVAQAGGVEGLGAAGGGGAPGAPPPPPTLLTARVDLDLVDDVRARMPVLSHLRPSLYSPAAVRVGAASLVDECGGDLPGALRGAWARAPEAPGEGRTTGAVGPAEGSGQRPF